MENLPRILLLACFAALSESTDLSESVFTFPTLGTTDRVTLTPSAKKPLSQASLCLRFYTDQSTQSPCFFSLATNSFSNAFLLCRMDTGIFRFHIGSASTDYLGLSYKLNEWNSVCVTWGEEHITQFFINGKASVRKIVPMSPDWQISTDHSIIVGQDQDHYRGGFEVKNAFAGHITDVHMWDYAISTCEVQRFMEKMSFQPGNYLKWESLEFEAQGKAKVEKKLLFSADVLC
ncbi:C-reactive protein-like [Alosa sapidissima]|uniref:C-reactive protein-like n=1 Tax=Alosa sapidissima TaxID=34773 RepID=UPI001C081CE5|nr:C-reactive protein-like [Alosa sapidissima]